MKKILICNHKMFLTNDEAVALKNELDNANFSNQELVICSSYLNLKIFDGYTLGAQDCFYEDKGPFTGEISAYDLSLRGIKYVLIGHFERRKYDTDKTISLKVKAALRNMITPIICIGETKMDRELRRTSEVIKKQLSVAVSNLKLEDDQEVIIAYEPAWSIGGNNTPSISEIEDTLTYVSKLLVQFGLKRYRLIYGGSVTASNIKNILSDKIDGYLIGSSSVDIDELKKISKCINGVNKDKI